MTHSLATPLATSQPTARSIAAPSAYVSASALAAHAGGLPSLCAAAAAAGAFLHGEKHTSDSQHVNPTLALGGSAFG